MLHEAFSRRQLELGLRLSFGYCRGGRGGDLEREELLSLVGVKIGDICIELIVLLKVSLLHVVLHHGGIGDLLTVHRHVHFH